MKNILIAYDGSECSEAIMTELQRAGLPSQLKAHVVAVDGSLTSQAAVRAVAERAWPTGTVVSLITVIEPGLRVADEIPGEHSVERLRRRDAILEWIQAMVTAAYRQLELVGLVPERHTLEGEAKPKLLEYAESWKADCIFIGASGLQHPATDTLGTVASALAVRACCSVEIVRPCSGEHHENKRTQPHPLRH